MIQSTGPVSGATPYPWRRTGPSGTPRLLIDKEMNKKDLIKKADISQSTLYKLTKDGNVNTDILIKICMALECDLTDIMELVPLEGK